MFQNEFEQSGARKRRPTLSPCLQQRHVSRRDLFTKSLGNRFKTMQLEDERAIGKEARTPTPTKISDEERERESSPMTTTDDDSEWSRSSSLRPIPTLHEKIKFRKSLNSAASMVFHGKTGLPLTSSPAPLRRGQNRFDFDSSLVSPAQLTSVIKKSHYPLRC